MAETIFAGEEKKEFAHKQGAAVPAFTHTILPGFPKNLFMSYRPGNAANRHC